MWTSLPSKWHEQAALFAAWFEMVGFNRHNDGTLDEATAKMRAAPAKEGLRLTARRELISTAEVRPTDWEESGIGGMLHFQGTAKRVETRYKVEHMSLAVVRVPLGGGADSPFAADRVRPLCGMLVRETKKDGTLEDVCWIYVAPHSFDHPIFQALERALYMMRVGPRVALGIAMWATTQDLDPQRYHGQIAKLTQAGARVTMCGEHHWNCEWKKASFGGDARLIAWSGRMNSWETVVRTLLPHAEELGGVYSLMALLVCLAVAATAHSATQAKAAVATLALDYLCVVGGAQLAHAPVVMLASRTAVLGPSWRRTLFVAWAISLVLVNLAVISRRETLLLATFVVALCSARRIHLALLTLRANHKASLALPLLSRLFGWNNTSPSPLRRAASDTELCLLDQPTTDELVGRRRAALGELRARWVVRWPRANELAAALCGAQRDAIPLDCVPAAAPAAADGGGGGGPSGGGPSDGRASPSAAVATAEAVRALTADNIARLKSVSQKEAVAFQLSGSEALMAAARLARVNTGKPLIITFGGGAHGWGDGVAAEGLALGEERYACDVLTLTEQCETTAHVLYHRRDEIAAVIVNPLAGVLADADEGGAKKGGGGGGGYGEWLRRLRAACDGCGVPLVFDESGCGFLLGRGGAQAHFDVVADAVCYGKALGGGLPLGALCGPAWLLQNSEPHLPLRAAVGVSGGDGVLGHPALMVRTNAVLRQLDAPAAAAAVAEREAAVAAWAAAVNADMAAAGHPLRVRSARCVWSIRFERAGRYHWMLQYLLADDAAALTALAPRVFGFAAETTAADLAALRAAILRAAGRMAADGWWPKADEVALNSDRKIAAQLVKEAAGSLLSRWVLWLGENLKR